MCIHTASYMSTVCLTSYWFVFKNIYNLSLLHTLVWSLVLLTPYTSCRMCDSDSACLFITVSALYISPPASGGAVDCTSGSTSSPPAGKMLPINDSKCLFHKWNSLLKLLTSLLVNLHLFGTLCVVSPCVKLTYCRSHFIISPEIGEILPFIVIMWLAVSMQFLQ